MIIRPLLSNVSVIGLFFIPMITMRLFAEEKRSGTIELLATSPIRDIEIILGKWLAAVILYACMLLFTAINFAFLFRYGNPDWKPLAIGYLGLLLQAGALLAHWNVYFHAHQESDHRRRRHLRRLPVAVGSGVGQRIRNRDLGASAGVYVGDHALRVVRQRRARLEGRSLLCVGDFPGTVSSPRVHGISALEVVNEYAVAEGRQTKYAAYAAVTFCRDHRVVVANVLANRYNKSYDATANKRYSLSEQTAKIVKGLKQDATITLLRSEHALSARAKTCSANTQSLSQKSTSSTSTPTRIPSWLAKPA